MIPALIAPAFLVPNPKLDTRTQWTTYDGSLDGVFEDVSTYGGTPAALANVGGAWYNAALNVGIAMEDGTNPILQMFRIDSPLVSERLGDQITFSSAFTNYNVGDFTADSQRIWMPHFDGTQMRIKFAEYDANGLIQISAASATPSVGGRNSRQVVHDLDSTRSLWVFEHLGTRVCIGQRSGGTLLSTVNFATFGATTIPGTAQMAGVRPLKSDRSLVLFATNTSSPFSIDVQGVAHAGTTPSATGSASTLTTNARNSGPTGVAPYSRLTRCVDGFGAADGRFIAAWVDATDGNLHLRMIRYDGTTITLGTELNSTVSIATGVAADLEDLGDGAAVFLKNSDPTASGHGFNIVEYDPEDVTNLTLTMSSLGQQQVAKDGFLTGHGVTGTGIVSTLFPISRNRFGVAVHNSFDLSFNVKIVHNGGDSIV